MRRRTFQSHEDAFTAAELLGKLEVASLQLGVVMMQWAVDEIFSSSAMPRQRSRKRSALPNPFEPSGSQLANYPIDSQSSSHQSESAQPVDRLKHLVHEHQLTPFATGESNNFNVIRTRTSSSRPPIKIRGKTEGGTERQRAVAAAVVAAAEPTRGSRHRGCTAVDKVAVAPKRANSSEAVEPKPKRQKASVQHPKRVGKALLNELDERPRVDSRKIKVGKSILASDGQALYDARIIEVDRSRAESYKVHYQGWNSKFDKWVSAAELRPTDDDAAAASIKAKPQHKKPKSTTTTAAAAATVPKATTGKKRRENGTAPGVRSRAVVDGLPNVAGSGLNGKFWGSPSKMAANQPLPKLKLTIEHVTAQRALEMYESMNCKVAAQLEMCKESNSAAASNKTVRFICAYHASSRKNPQPLAVLGWAKRASCLRRTVISVLLAATVDSNPKFCQALASLLQEAINSPQASDCLWTEALLDGSQEAASVWNALKFEVDADAQRALKAIRPFRRDLSVGGKLFHLEMQPVSKALEAAKIFMEEDHNGLTYMLRTLERVAQETGHWHCTQMLLLDGKQAGFVCARVTLSRRKPTLEVMALYVLEQYREKGIGQQLVTSLLQAAAVGIMGKEGLPHAQARVTLPFCMQHSKGFWERYGFDTSAGHFAVLRSIEKVL